MRMSMSMSACYIIIFVLLSFLSLTTLADNENETIVTLSVGQVRGTIMKSLSGKKFHAFRGIPYAEPPIGNQRFMAPQPAAKWDDVLNATEDSPVCPQPVAFIPKNEDCLKINVYTSSFNESRPVIVYIHGGANVLGSGHSEYEAGPDYLLDFDVVFVSFNYRLGILGFLSLGRDTEFKGNFGYLDQVLALKWVRDHIEQFGGNPKLVTIMGMSAGAMAVTLHMVSPLSTGLFRHAIAMSGSATNHFSIDNAFWTRKVARDAGCPMYDPYLVVECLRTVSWERLIEICQLYEPYKVVNMKWNYEIDNHFLHNHPTELFASGKFNKVPIIIGYTKNELDYSLAHQEDNQPLQRDVRLYFDEYAPEFFLFDYDPHKSIKIKTFYFDQNETQTLESLTQLGEVFSDSIIGHGVHRLVDIARKYTNVYYYRTDYIGSHTNGAPFGENGHPIGVAHADDLQYVMPGTWYGPKMELTDPHVFMIVRILSWFVRFAQTGIPDLVDKWAPCTLAEKNILYNDVETSLDEVEKPTESRYKLWDELFPAPSSASRIQGAINVFVNFVLATVGISLFAP